jgi:competence protein ComEC
MFEAFVVRIFSMIWWVLKRRVHISWLIALSCCGVVVGIIISQYINQVWFSSISWPLVALALIILVGWHRSIYLIPLILLGGLLLGLWRGSIDQAQLEVYKRLYGSELTLSGQLYDDVDINAGNTLALRLKGLSIHQESLQGKIWVTVKTTDKLKRGDIVTIRGQLKTGFGSFVGSIYRAELIRTQRPEPGDIAGRVRDWFAVSTRLALPEPEASLGIGYLVGQRRVLPLELDEALKTVGLTHIVVASGYNLTILVRLARRLFKKVSKYLAALAASSMIVGFIAITGLSPSMSRAGLVAGLSLAAWYYGRKFHPLVLLPLAATVTLLFNPSYAWGDLGWQLSFVAFGGVMIVAPLLQAYFFGDKKPGTIRQILCEAVAAQLCTAPIIIAAFGEMSNIAVLANILVLPLVPLAMLLTFVAGLGGLIWPVVATIIGWPAYLVLHYMVTVVQHLANLPWATSSITFNGLSVAACYIVIILASVYMWRATKYNLRQASIVE